MGGFDPVVGFVTQTNPNLVAFVRGLMTPDKMHRELCFTGFRHDLF